MKSGEYNGFPNWNQWNVSLWLNNDEGMYNTMRECLKTSKTRRKAACRLQGMLPAKTPDGARYSVVAILGAMEGL
jgi:hypothetical protein